MSEGQNVVPVVIEREVTEAEEAEPRQCHECGHFSGNGCGEVNRGRIGRDAAGRFVPDWVCARCAAEERDLLAKGVKPKDKRPLLRTRDLLTEIGRLNAAREEQVAAAERETAWFDQAKAYFKALADGKAEPPVVRKDANGMLACGIVGCPWCRDKDDRVEYFAGVKVGEQFAVVGLCLAQFAALKKSGAEIPASKIFREMVREVGRLNARAKAFARFQTYWKELAAGLAKTLPKAVMVEGNDRCSLSASGCCRGDKLVEHLVVFRGEAGYEIAGICPRQAAALAKADVRLFVAKGTGARARCEDWIEEQKVRDLRASFRHAPRPDAKPRPQDFDKIGGGLARFRPVEKAAEIRREKRETREERERRRDKRRAALAAAIGNRKFGNGKRHKGGK